ncbi:MAG: hypothetical protein ABI212_14550 [Burkholderiaceae bacterium]
MFFAAGPLEAAITNKSLGVEVPQEKASFVGYGNLATAIDTLERAVAGRQFIAGNAFSAADVYVGSQIGWGLQFKTIEARPAFEKYWAGIAQRPALKRADMINDARLAARPDSSAPQFLAHSLKLSPTSWCCGRRLQAVFDQFSPARPGTCAPGK